MSPKACQARRFDRAIELCTFEQQMTQIKKVEFFGQENFYPHLGGDRIFPSRQNTPFFRYEKANIFSKKVKRHEDR